MGYVREGVTGKPFLVVAKVNNLYISLVARWNFVSLQDYVGHRSLCISNVHYHAMHGLLGILNS